MSESKFTGYINNSVLYLKYGEYQGSCIIDNNFRQIDLEYLLEYLSAIHSPYSDTDTIEVNLQAPYNKQTIKLSNRPYLNEIATMQQKDIQDLSNRVSALEKNRYKYRLRFSLKNLDCGNKGNDFNEYLKAINAHIKSYEVIDQEVEFVVQSVFDKPHQILLCKVEDSPNYFLEKKCNAIEENKLYYIDVQQKNPKSDSKFNTVLLKIIKLNFNDKQWYLIE